MATRSEQARAVLRANDRGGYCVPTARLYPFQWNWDSAFVALGFQTFDEAQGIVEFFARVQATTDAERDQRAGVTAQIFLCEVVIGALWKP